MRPRNAFRNSVFGASKLASAKTPLLKPYYRLHGVTKEQRRVTESDGECPTAGGLWCRQCRPKLAPVARGGTFSDSNGVAVVVLVKA